MSSTLWFCHASRMHFSLHKEMCANSTCFPQPLQDPTLHSLLLWKVTCPPPAEFRDGGSWKREARSAAWVELCPCNTSSKTRCVDKRQLAPSQSLEQRWPIALVCSNFSYKNIHTPTSLSELLCAL